MPDNLNYPSRRRNKDVSPQRVTNPPTRDVNAASRAASALKLRAELLTYDEIAKRCGYASAGAARKAVLREMDRTIVKNVDELRDAELHMLNILHSECWKSFMDKSNQWRYQEVDRILRISERRARLMGLDTPVDSALMSNVVVVREVPQGLLSAGEVQG